MVSEKGRMQLIEGHSKKFVPCPVVNEKSLKGF